MNSTSETLDGEQPDQRGTTASPYAYSIGIFLAVSVLLVVITYTYYHIYARNHHSPAGGGGGGNSINNNNTSISDQESPHHEYSSGLDEASIHAYPKLLYSRVKEFKGDSTSSASGNVNAAGCSICLQDYKDVDVLRILSECGHFFHQKCVDPWLRIHPTCPICRNYPVPATSDTSVPAAVASESEIFV